jgi:hypothetical protein
LCESRFRVFRPLFNPEMEVGKMEDINNRRHGRFLSYNI